MYYLPISDLETKGSMEELADSIILQEKAEGGLAGGLLWGLVVLSVIVLVLGVWFAGIRK